MKVAFVVPRYGEEVVGGAELGARMLAERLVSMRGWSVEVFTTCARDHTTWADEYEAGATEVNGVRVHRFASESGRAQDFNEYSGPLLRDPGAATDEQCVRWIQMQGPVCPDAVDAAASSDASVVAFYPYLYYPTVYGIPRLGPRAVMHPAAHDEPPIRLRLFREVFESTSGFVFQTRGERSFVHELFPVAEKPQVLVGLGIEPRPGDRDAATAAVGFDVGPSERPYVCCIGRVDHMKGTTLLAEMFAEFKRRNPSRLALVLAGPVVNDPPPHPDIVTTGTVSEAAKWGILENSRALISPSPHEAFSLVVIEGWTAGVPVLVNGDCAATREHCEISGGGAWFGGAGSADAYDDFERALSRFCRDGSDVAAMVEAGQRYARANFSWDVVIGRYSAFLESMAQRAAA